MSLRALLMAMVMALAGCASDGMPTGAAAKEAAKLNLQLGAEYASKGDYDLAVIKLQRAIKQDPDLAPAHSTLAYAYSALGRNELAEEQYRKALSLGGDDGNVRNNFGVFLCAHGKPEEAQRYFIEAANYRDYATPAAAWTNAGVCARRQPDLAAAERYFRQALQINPNFPDALAQMVWLSYQKKDHLRCRAFLQRYEAVGQPTAETLWIGALNERELGDLGAAQDYASRLKQKFPDSEQALNLQSSPQ